MGLLKILLWIFVISIIAYAIYMTYVDISKHIPQEKKNRKFKNLNEAAQRNAQKDTDNFLVTVN
jgi:uncharacterized membrane protein